MRARLVVGLWAFSLGVTGCVADAVSGYDPDWEAEGSIAAGKADGFVDELPELALGGSVTGDVGGQRVEMYRIDLRRTDRIQLEMEVTSGDLNPHLTVYWGASRSIHSASWSRDGNVLRKVYEVEEAGRYVVAARAYRHEGEGQYALRAICLGGPCAGELPPPGSDLDVGEVAVCISKARRCAFSRLGRYGGAVGPARAGELFTECLGEAALEDGSSCAAACEWKGDREADEHDDAAPLCDSIVGSLPFYADQSAACLTQLDDCMGACYGVESYSDSSALWETKESLCWRDGFNGNCDSYARSHAACGGNVLEGSARECVLLCHATTGAHVDDLDTMCSSDTDCDSYCEVDLAQAGEACGGLTAANRTCLVDWISDEEAWMCEEALESAIGGPG